MSTIQHTFFRFAVSEDVLSLRDLASCLNIGKKDIHVMRLIDIGEDGWNTYEFDLNCELKAEKVNEEFGETFLLKNVYLNGIPLEDYEYDDTKSSADTVDSDLLTDTDVESDDEDDDEGDDDDEEDDDEDDEEDDDEGDETSDLDTSHTSSDSDESAESCESNDSATKTSAEIYASIKKKFPFLSDDSPTEAYKSLTELLNPLIKAEKLVIGNTTTGDSNLCTGYFLTKDGEFFLYTY
jgi:hypothetical protein